MADSLCSLRIVALPAAHNGICNVMAVRHKTNTPRSSLRKPSVSQRTSLQIPSFGEDDYSPGPTANHSASNWSALRISQSHGLIEGLSHATEANVRALAVDWRKEECQNLTRNMHGEVFGSVGDVVDHLRKGMRSNDNDGSAQNNDVHCERSVRGRVPEQKNYSQKAISTLLDLVEDNEPLEANMWAEVYHQYQT